MSRPAKGPRLYYRRKKGRKPVYVIRDGGHEHSTGTTDRKSAEAELKQYLIWKDLDPASLDPESATVAQVLAKYGAEHAPTTQDPARIGYAISALVDWWGTTPVKNINIRACQNYAKSRDRAPSTIRRELGCLRSAVLFCFPAWEPKGKFWMPPKPSAKDRVLTRSEVARLIRAARANPRTRYLARFILIGIYTGSRKSVIRSLKWRSHSNGGWVDTKAGVLYRKARNATETKKRAPTVRIPRKLLAHVRRWRASATSDWVVDGSYYGAYDFKNAWELMRERAGLRDVTPHTLRHTAITWALQAGVTPWQAAGFFGATADTIEREYGHHHPDHNKAALSGVDLGGKDRT